ncbi:jasmonate-induced oxygenase 2-like [Silene latifolia]|uniref:jasmonate-induced oxygenase 2-like n=1 Tax=Silene latifolia TaxID=37657 RepID=UPI003D76F9F3
MSCTTQEWPEPIVRVQSIADSGLDHIPDRYVKPMSERPIVEPVVTTDMDIPLVDLAGLFSSDLDVVQDTRNKVAQACQEWGFFQAINHGIEPGLMDQARQVWREFFHSPMENKQKHANSPCTYEGYGSRLGVVKGAVLDWSDYYFLHYLPPVLKDYKKWPDEPPHHRDVVEKYLQELVKLSGRLMTVLSANLGLEEDYLQNAFGGEEVGACLRANFYPKCPQPDLTLGLSPHSDPGGMTILLPDHNVPGLQVRKDDKWITVKPVPHAFIINMGDQIQVLSNAIYKSVEHRVIVNPNLERVSLAFFYNPKGDLVIEPAKKVITEENPALYPAMTFNEYRLYIRLKGPRGKSQVDSLKSPK